jgi:uncharacterized protein (TIGR03083 family)
VSPLAPPPPQRFEIVRSIRNERHRTLRFLQEQPPEAFDAPATPGWQVRDVVAHLITLDRAAVTGTMIPLALGSGVERIERWNDRAVRKFAEQPVPAMLLGLDRWGRRFARMMELLPRRLYRLTLPTAWGKVPGAFVVAIRAYDEFVHRQDIRRALGLDDDRVDATQIAEFLLSALPSNAMPGAAREAGTGAVAVNVAGEPLPEWVYDLGAGAFGPRASTDAVDATVTVPATPFVMAAAARDSFEALESSGTLTISGDADLARTFLSNIHLV